MSSEIKSGSTFLQGRCSKSLKSKFKKHCKDLNVSMSQRIKDLAQADMREHGYKKFTDDLVGQTPEKST
jgi:hypothetical protein